ncbi:hypothetical protein I3760_06G115200 [Carya illinoinensis]|nr:hypothetical protein I3760_06G115200 [Carya illinoinensis]KAG2702952.1 hypothetical protein I3760_06G115200 [Carya illinoinensis]
MPRIITPTPRIAHLSPTPPPTPALPILSPPHPTHCPYSPPCDVDIWFSDQLEFLMDRLSTAPSHLYSSKKPSESPKLFLATLSKSPKLDL